MTGERPIETFAGRTAFITGGGSGIGAGLAEAFLEVGAKVVIADLHEDRLAETKKALGICDVLTIALDVTNRAAWAAAADLAESTFGQVDILCNNAGVNVEVPVSEARYEDWDWILGVNLGGCVNGVQTFVPRFRKRGGPAHIVNTASILSLLPMGPAAIYTTSKFAIRGLSSALRLDLARHGIGVSCLCPALVRSRGMEAEASRPDHLAVAGRAPGPGAEAIAATNALGMDPLEVGRKTLAGIGRNQELIFTHPEHAEEAEGYCARLLRSFPDEAAPNDRAALELEMSGMRTAARETADALRTFVHRADQNNCQR